MIEDYAVYVWLSYLAAALVTGGLAILSLRRLRRAEAKLARLKENDKP